MSKTTDKEIIKALENAKSVVDDNDNETLDFFNNCIDLINRQQAEIERLEKILNGKDQLINALNKLGRNCRRFRRVCF